MTAQRHGFPVHVLLADHADPELLSHSQSNIDDGNFLNTRNHERVALVMRLGRTVDERIDGDSLDLDSLVPDGDLDDSILGEYTTPHTHALRGRGADLDRHLLLDHGYGDTARGGDREIAPPSGQHVTARRIVLELLERNAHARPRRELDERRRMVGIVCIDADQTCVHAIGIDDPRSSMHTHGVTSR
jgi:hypothetical protein